MKKIFKKIWLRVLKCIINLDKSSVFKMLKSEDFDEIVLKLNDPSQFEWPRIRLASRPSKFEDLTALFFCSPLNRGILRQDIDEAALLFKYVSEIDSPKGVEIGRFYGGSTVLLGTAVGKEGRLYSIDISPKNQDTELINILRETGLNERVKLIIGDANSVEINEDLDFVFIDGDHSYNGARLDHNKWGAKIKKGGFIIHHDMTNSRMYSTQWNVLRQLYESIIFFQKGYIKVFAEAGSMIIFQRISDTWIDVPIATESKENTQINT